jgi:mevalonate kinase
MISITLPSKTFLLGEYVVLEKGPGLILNTAPRFEMRLTQPNGISEVFHPASPAARWICQHLDFFQKFNIRFFDPHEGKGGFGASSAQFIAVFAAQMALQQQQRAFDPLDANLFLENYFNVFDTSTTLPSGADVVAQVCGGAAYWHRAENNLVILNWPFMDLAYCLLRTGYKQPTHLRLQRLSKAAYAEMANIVQEGYTAFQSNDASLFAHTVADYYACMKKEKCLLESTINLVEYLYQSKLILAAKGCGALGADVVLALLRPEKIGAFLAFLQANSIEPVCWGREIGEGINLRTYSESR